MNFIIKRDPVLLAASRSQLTFRIDTVNAGAQAVATIALPVLLLSSVEAWYSLL